MIEVPWENQAHVINTPGNPEKHPLVDTEDSATKDLPWPRRNFAPSGGPSPLGT